MSLLDTLILSFGTEGLGEVAKEIKETEQKITSLEKKEKELNETIKKGGKEAEEAKKKLKEVQTELGAARQKLTGLQNSTGGLILKFKEAASAGAKFLGAFVALKKLSDMTADFAENALDLAEAAKEAGLSIEAYQNKEFRGYELFTRQDVNNAKEYEQVMRDIRMGGAAITNNLARIFLPVLIKIGKVIRQVTDFFVEHGALVKSAFLIIGAIITGVVIKSILAMAPALWSALAPILPIIAAVALLALAFEDLIVWINGGESAFGDLWDEMFGGVEGAKALFNELMETFKELWEVAAPILKAIGDFLLKVVYSAIKHVVSAIKDVVEGFKALTSGSILEGLMKLVSAFVKLTPGGMAIGTTVETVKTANDKPQPDGSAKSGLDYVPFDGYIAELHKGERVQTADEANDWRSGLMAAKRAVNFTASYPLNAIPSGAVSNAYNSSSTSRTINIGDITIQTQATDAQGIAQDLASYIKQAVISLDDGMLA